MQEVINTQSLQQKFIPEYQEFFSKCDVVYSAPIQFSWSGGFAVYHGGMCMLQKLPLRTYVGIRKTSSLTHVASYRSYSPSKDEFRDVSVFDLLKTQLGVILEESVFPNIPDYDQSSFEIHILSENDWGDTNPLSLCLAMSLLEYYKEVESADVDSWMDMEPEDLLRNDIFQRVYRYACEVAEAIINDPHHGSSGAGFACAMLTSDFPVLFQKRGQKITHFRRVSDVTGPSTFLPFDYCIIDPGKHIQHFWNATYAMIQEDSCSKVLDDFFGEDHSKYSLLNDVVKVLNTYSKKTIEGYIGAVTDNDIRSFIKYMGKFYEFLDLYCFDTLNGHPETALKKIRKSIAAHTKCPLDELFLKQKLIVSDQKYLMVIPQGIFPPVVNDVFDEVRKNHGIELSLDYASFRDGVGTEALRLEHHVERKMVNPIMQNCHYVICDSSGSRKLIDAASIRAVSEEYDLVLHHHDNKMYINGEPLSSKELPSQRYAIEIIRLLLEKQELGVHNKNLPMSTYASNKADMMKKIIKPMQELLFARTEKEFKFIVEGTMKNFYIYMHPGDLSLAQVFNLLSNHDE